MSHSIKKIASFVTLCLGLVVFASEGANAQNNEVQLGDLVLSNIWARATPPNAKNAAAYITIKNNGSMMDMIMEANSTIAMKTQIHQSKMEDGVMKMEHVGHTMIKPGGTLEMKPGGYHIMFMKVNQKLVDGDSFMLSVTFQNAGTIELEVPIRKTQ